MKIFIYGTLNPEIDSGINSAQDFVQSVFCPQLHGVPVNQTLSNSQCTAIRQMVDLRLKRYAVYTAIKRVKSI